MSILIRVILWKGSSKKDMKGSRWHWGDSWRRVITAANCPLFFLQTHIHIYVYTLKWISCNAAVMFIYPLFFCVPAGKSSSSYFKEDKLQVLTWARWRSSPGRSGCGRSQCRQGSCAGRGSGWCRRCQERPDPQICGPPGLSRTCGVIKQTFYTKKKNVQLFRTVKNNWQRRNYQLTSVRKWIITSFLFFPPSVGIFVWNTKWPRRTSTHKLRSYFPIPSSPSVLPSAVSHLSLTSRTLRMLEKRVFLSLMIMVSSRSRLSRKCSVRTRRDRR